MSYIQWNITPEIIPGFEYLRWYGLCWVIGLMVGYRLMQHFYKKATIDIQELDHLTTYLVVGIIVGARLGHIIFYDPLHYLQNPIEILPIKIDPEFRFTGFTGLASHGGIAGALLALYLYHRKYGTSYAWLSDRLMIAGVATGGFIRLGNLVNSEIIGTPTDVPWAFIFTRIDDIPRHPAQLYEALFYFALCIGLYLLWKSNRYSQQKGFIFGLGLLLIFIQRFLIEFVKENQMSFEDGLTLNMGQMLSVPMMIAGLIIIIMSYRKRPIETESISAS